MWKRNRRQKIDSQQNRESLSQERSRQGDFQRSESGRGGRNLVLLGVGASLVALCSTSVALLIYHNSGDIYLDRSRPGFLPDEQEIEDESEQVQDEYELPKSGELTKEDLDKYLENLKIEIQSVDAYESPFGEKVMSDEWLGIPVIKQESVEGEG